MPDLDQLLDAFVADVRSETRAPGASMAIEQAHRRRKVGAAVAAVAVIAVGGGLAAGTLRGSDQVSPIGEPTPSTVQESAEPTPKSFEELNAEFDAIFSKVPGWTTNTGPGTRGYDYAHHGPCAGNWTKSAESKEGGIDWLSVGDDAFGLVWGANFPSEAQAVDAVARFVENLESCTTTAWRTQPIASNGAALASSDGTVAWIQQTGSDVQVLQVGTTDGPPPVRVQVKVAEWLVDFSAYHIASHTGYY